MCAMGHGWDSPIPLLVTVVDDRAGSVGTFTSEVLCLPSRWPFVGVSIALPCDKSATPSAWEVPCAPLGEVSHLCSQGC